MRMRGWTIMTLAIAALAACTCPPPPPVPGSRLVGLAGSATTAPVGTDVGWGVTGLAYQGDLLLVATNDDGVERLDPATGKRSRLTPKDRSDLDLGTVTVLATGSAGTAWLSDRSKIYKLAADDAVTTFDDGEPPRPSPAPSASPTPTPSPSGPPVFPSPDIAEHWGKEGVQALADDGAGGVWVARGEWIWHATPDGVRTRAAVLPRAAEALVQWNGGLVVLLGNRRFGDSDALALLELMPGKPAAPWRHMQKQRSTTALAVDAEGAMVVATVSRDSVAAGYRPVGVYDPKVDRVAVDGARKTIIQAEEDTGTPGGYKLMLSCAGPDYPDDYDVGALAVANDGRAAFVLKERDRLVVWKP